MITFFTTLKPLSGKNKINQLNALRSWKALSENAEIIVFDDLIGEAEEIIKLGIIHIGDVQRYSDEIRLPLINDMFYKASKFASNPVCCFVNADIILDKYFYDSVCFLHEELKNDYLLCGQRYDFDIEEEIAFDKFWFEAFKKKYEKHFELHVPHGSDYFVFPRFQYDLNNMPQMAVGRPGWDNWMISNAISERKLKVVDLSKSLKVFHQNHNRGYSGDPAVEKETESNFNTLSVRIFILKDANYYFEDHKIKKKTMLYRLIHYKLPNLYKRFGFK